MKVKTRCPTYEARRSNPTMTHNRLFTIPTAKGYEADVHLIGASATARSAANSFDKRNTMLEEYGRDRPEFEASIEYDENQDSAEYFDAEEEYRNHKIYNTIYNRKEWKKVIKRFAKFVLISIVISVSVKALSSYISMEMMNKWPTGLTDALHYIKSSYDSAISHMNKIFGRS